MITDANVGEFLTQRHPDFAPLYQSHLDVWGTDPSARYILLRTFAEEFMTPQLRTGSPEERTRLFDTVEQLLTDGDSLIDDAADHQIIDELVYVGYTLKDDPVDLTGAGAETTARIARTRDWRPGQA
ncbi:hypothetical protein ABH926_010339 [Catenulispora sp. GP43]|uniref:DUF7674 family protein n=1 Tax=Catenulispora sp. GP43 TaxID=3156263 RepID=UPI0035170033